MPSETVYVGVVGSQGCSILDVVAHTYTGGNCTEPRNFAEVNPTSGAEEMTLEHYTHSSCTAGGFTDFVVNIHDRIPRQGCNDNLVFEVEPLGDVSDPSALTMLLYPDDIPPGRSSEICSERSSHGIYRMSVVDEEDGD